MVDAYVFFDINTLFLYGTKEDCKPYVSHSLMGLSIKGQEICAVNYQSTTAILGQLDYRGFKFGFLYPSEFSNESQYKSVLETLYGLPEETLDKSEFISNREYGPSTKSFTERICTAKQQRSEFSKDAHVTVVTPYAREERKARKKHLGYIFVDSTSKDSMYLSELASLQPTLEPDPANPARKHRLSLF